MYPKKNRIQAKLWSRNNVNLLIHWIFKRLLFGFTVHPPKDRKPGKRYSQNPHFCEYCI